MTVLYTKVFTIFCFRTLTLDVGTESGLIGECFGERETYVRMSKLIHFKVRTDIFDPIKKKKKVLLKL